MPITHLFVSGIPDSTDSTIVRPSDWNNNHQVEHKITSISFADSPYQALITDEIIKVDTSGGDVVIILYLRVEGLELQIKKKTAANKITYQGNGSNIDGLSERDILGQYNTDRLIAEDVEWGRY